MNAIEKLREKKKKLHAEIERRYVCEHQRRGLRFRLAADNRPTYYRQCIKCGHAGQAVSAREAKKETAGKAIPDFDYEAEEKRRKTKCDEYSFVSLELKQEFRLMYEDYLRSDQWKQKRIQVLERAKGKCEVCKLSDATDIHHNTYDSFGEEPLGDLDAVCDFCHKVLHGRITL
jgi:hypothetical protein